MFIILRVKWDNCGLAKAASRQGWTKSKHKNCYWSRLAHDLGFVLHGKWAGLSKKGVSILFNVLCNTHQQENATGPWHDWDFSESSTGFPPQKPRLWSATPMGPIGRRVELCRHFEGRQKYLLFPALRRTEQDILGMYYTKSNATTIPAGHETDKYLESSQTCTTFLELLRKVYPHSKHNCVMWSLANTHSCNQFFCLALTSLFSTSYDRRWR